MTLERYNQFVIAIIGTAASLGGLALAAFISLSVLRSSSPPAVLVNTPNTEPQPQNLAFCPPITDHTGAYQYIPVGVVVASDADRDAVLRSPVSYSKRFESCSILKYGNASRIFNVVVRSLTTGEQRLLLKTSAQIASLELPEDKCSAGEGPTPCGFLLWQIRASDTNNDGRINRDDVLSAYVSDLSAQKLTQLTPNDANLLEAQWSSRSRTWQFQVRHDANGDGTFSEEDGSEVIEADVSAQTAAARSIVEPSVLEALRNAVQ